MKLTAGLKEFILETDATLKGYGRRNLIARTVKALGKGGQALAERELGWNRVTIRKALAELAGGFCYIDQYHKRGREKMEQSIPNC